MTLVIDFITENFILEIHCYFCQCNNHTTFKSLTLKSVLSRKGGLRELRDSNIGDCCKSPLYRE